MFLATGIATAKLKVVYGSPVSEASSKPDDVAARWLKRAEAEVAGVPRLHQDFPRRRWIQWMVQSYVDLDRPEEALKMTLRNQRQFNVDVVREVIYYMASRLAAKGEHAKARKHALLLANGMPQNIHVRKPHRYISLMIDITARQAERGDFVEAIKTAAKIPKNNWPFERARAFRAIGLYSARQGNLKVIRKIEHEFPPRMPRDEYYATLAFELSKAGAFEAADEISKVLPTSLRQAVLASKAIDLADKGRDEQAVAAIDQITRSGARDALIHRLIATLVWRGNGSAAQELAQKIEPDYEQQAAHQVIQTTKDWMSKPNDPASGFTASSYFAQVATLMNAFPPTEKRDGGVDPFEAYANFPVTPGISYDKSGARHLDDVSRKILDVASMGWNRQSLESANEQNVSTASFDNSADLETALLKFTALTAVAESIGESKMAGEFAVKGLQVASKLGFEQHSRLTTYLMTTAARNGHGDTVLSVLKQSRIDAIAYEDRTADSFDDSTLSGRVAFAFAVSGQPEIVEAMLKDAPTPEERSIICLGAARGSLAITRPVKFLPVVEDIDQLLDYILLPNDPMFWAKANRFNITPTYFKGQY